MKILILGGNGMLGHKFFQLWKDKHLVKVTLKKTASNYAKLGLYNDQNSFFNIDLNSLSEVEKILDVYSPEVIVNAIGITKRLNNIDAPGLPIKINALFPHLLSDLCKKNKIHLIHLSTDCIFSGRKGMYKETDNSDAEDLYGRTKYLGEVNDEHVLTIRKSSIGLELSNTHGLVEWYLSQRGQIKGYRKAIYSGLISTELAKVIEMILSDFPDMHGIWNIASKPISKYDLLTGLNKRLERTDLEIIPDDEFICDRSVDGSYFEKRTGYIAPSWDEMLDVLAEEIREKINDIK